MRNVKLIITQHETVYIIDSKFVMRNVKCYSQTDLNLKFSNQTTI